jgi:anti-anti-sigma factor
MHGSGIDRDAGRLYTALGCPVSGRWRPGIEPPVMTWLTVDTIVNRGSIDIRCAGAVDVATCAKLIDALDRVERREVEAICIDLSEVTFIDSTGIGCLLHGALKAEKAGISFVVIASDAVERFVTVSGLGSHLRTQCPSQDRLPGAMPGQ